MLRIFRIISLCVVIGTSITHTVSTANAAGRIHEIADSVYSFTLGLGNHSMFVIGSESVAVFETFDSRHPRALLKAIRNISDKPVSHVFHSHNHWDHASGGQVFKDENSQAVMHALAAEWLAAHPGQDSSPPDITWSGDSHNIKMGDFTVELAYLGLNHGLGMTIFTIPERKVAYIADLVTPNRVMFSVVPDFNIGEWERSLGEIMQMEFDIAVCAHNELPIDEAIKGCTLEHVTLQRQFIRDLRNAILDQFQQGTEFMAIPKAVKLPQYSDWVGYDEWLEMNTLRLMTDLYMGPFPWVPNSQ